MQRVSAMLRAAGRTAFLSIFLLVAASLVPGDEAYYRIERTLSTVGPLGHASQHIRSISPTFASILLEGTQGRSVTVEGVPINLGYAVNRTEHVHEGRLYSRVLGEPRTFWVYLPPGYQHSRDSYPVVYLLHGMSQNHMWWTEVARMDRIVTRMIEAGKIRPAIIVMPNGNRDESDESTTSLYDNRCRTGLDSVARMLAAIGDRFPGLKVYNISCNGDFERHIVYEVVKEIDARYRTNGQRYVGGFSIGGRGAMQLALANNGVFDGAFGLSGNYDFLRGALRRGEIEVPDGARLFLAAGSQDQRGVYGTLNTYLFHRDLVDHGIDHLYCTYNGTHSDAGWVVAIPQAMRYLLGTESDGEASRCQGECGPEDACELAQPDGPEETDHSGRGAG